MDFDNPRSSLSSEVSVEPSEDDYNHPLHKKQKRTTPNEIIATHFGSLIEYVDEFADECMKNVRFFNKKVDEQNEDMDMNDDKCEYYLPDDCSPVFKHYKELKFDISQPRDAFDEKFNEKFVPETSELGKPNEFDIDAKFSQVPFSEHLKNIKVRDYINQSRDSIVSEVKRARDETLAYYETIKSECDDELPENELRQKLFANKSCMLFQPKRMEGRFSSIKNRSVFPIYLFVFDFHLDQQLQFDLA